MHTVFCTKLQQHAQALDKAPLPGAIGQRILQEISLPAWQLWLEKQTKIINENRLSPIDPAHKAQLLSEMETFLFDGK
jgi:Fe-S cluster biosynthesis and repair protein YggX